MALLSLYNQVELVDIFKLERNHLKLDTMAHSLSQLNRYTGHALFPYSVAQHSFLLSKFIPERLKACALIHDWSEAFTNDVASPVKAMLPEYRNFENSMQRKIFELMNVPWSLMEEIHTFDRRICADEMAVLFPNNPNVYKDDELGVPINEIRWDDMKIMYLRALQETFE